MTNNKLTDAQDFWLAPERLEDIAKGEPLVDGEAAGMAQRLLAAQAHIRRQEQIMLNQDESLALRRAELQEYRKAAGEPVAFDALRDAVAEVTGGLPVEFDEGHIHKGHQSVPFMNFNSLSRIVEKFRAPQPAPAVEAVPVVSFYRDGIEAAARWVDLQRESHDNEHGRHDPDTGSFEFGNDAQREYSDTLVDIAEGIRALHPNACRAT